ncbi:hypothetical protein BKA70DRAFT_1424599 [Coprinopsis sp. MPI-PUGE-AT-0042]|nr:hypothetical protein BKA70DRAFT_1424599 [Coprinopsis sp. MPI-PUGE-AT-0042]
MTTPASSSQSKERKAHLSRTTLPTPFDSASLFTLFSKPKVLVPWRRAEPCPFREALLRERQDLREAAFGDILEEPHSVGGITTSMVSLSLNSDPSSNATQQPPTTPLFNTATQMSMTSTPSTTLPPPTPTSTPVASNTPSTITL